MTITYRWDIVSVSCVPSANSLKNVVSEIHWQLFANDETNTANVYGAVGVEGVDPDNFINYEDLTKEQIIEWAELAIGEDKIEIHKSALASQLSALSNPQKVSRPLPWI
jgi:hypothetical protein